ncbi:amino acid ABC transporter permease [uncultured Granulicatella sp.]|uniref:amino acid ABC transporter permease n=1 Tax=uncultured Granulicatella sp. TaxID=316089 RepID=UPI0028D0718E|nr:amino acid ABC transporter permease [uncultured Granulicatella sp.]
MFNLKLAIHSLSFVLSGLQYTLGIAAVSFILGTILGFLFVLMKRSPFLLLRVIANFHVSFMRGTPTLVFLFLLYFGLPYFKIQLPAIICSIICFSIVSSAYICEVLRSSIDAVDYGQWEASISLGLNYFQTLRRVIVPQAFRISVPPLSNVLLDMIKGTSLAAMITVPDIFQNAKIVGGREFDYMTMYILVAFIYWCICLVFEQGQKILEKRLSLY